MGRRQPTPSDPKDTIRFAPLIISVLLLVFLSALLTNVMNNTTIAAVFVPILISLSLTDPTLNPVLLVMAVTLATTFGYSLPSASGRMAEVTFLAERIIILTHNDPDPDAIGSAVALRHLLTTRQNTQNGIVFSKTANPVC